MSKIGKKYKSNKKKAKALKALKNGIARKANRPNGGCFHSSVWVRNELHKEKQLMASARANTSKCVTIKPDKEVFDAILTEMMSGRNTIKAPF